MNVDAIAKRIAAAINHRDVKAKGSCIVIENVERVGTLFANEEHRIQLRKDQPVSKDKEQVLVQTNVSSGQNPNLLATVRVPKNAPLAPPPAPKVKLTVKK